MDELQLQFPVLELFSSISGEAQHAGELTTFVRFAGCNLRCAYCDTQKLLDENKFTMMSIEQIVEACHKNGHKHVILTGGEPLIQKHIDALIAELMLESFEVELETNGSVDFHPLVEALDARELPYALANNYMFTIDWKTGASGMTDKMSSNIFDHLDDLGSQDTIKFVVAEDDIEPAMELIEKFQKQGTLCKYYISPVFGQVDMVHIVDAMKKHKVNDEVRIQVQLHKIIWDPNKTGV